MCLGLPHDSSGFGLGRIRRSTKGRRPPTFSSSFPYIDLSLSLANPDWNSGSFEGMGLRAYGYLGLRNLRAFWDFEHLLKVGLDRAVNRCFCDPPPHVHSVFLMVFLKKALPPT